MPRQHALICLIGAACVTGCAGSGLRWGSGGSAVAPMIGTEQEEFEISGRYCAVEAEPKVDIQRPLRSNLPSSHNSPSMVLAASRRGGSPAATKPATTKTLTLTEVVGQRLEAELLESSLDLTSTIASVESPLSTVASECSTAQINLPTALSMVGPQHPAVGFARWRVQQAYAQLDQARILWLPTLRAGVGFHRHDGNYQASNGDIVDVNRNSLQYGLGVGAVGAGTTTLPGIVARFHFADAIFQPKIADHTARARTCGSQAVLNERMMVAAVTYLDLLGAHQEVRIMEEIRGRAAELSKLTGDFAATGAGLQSDADRMETELALVDNRLLACREQKDIAAARLSEATSADATCQWMPMDATVLPLDVVSLETDRASLIQTGLANRPELREARALVAAACERYRREQFGPFVPSVLLGFSTGGFGGGLGSNVDNIDSRYDFDALVAWEIRNLGFGEHAARRDTSAQVQQAKFEKIRMMDQVAREVSEAYSQVSFRSQQVAVARHAIENASQSYDRNLSRIRDGQGLPLESLQSLRALEEAQRAYVRAVTEYNQAQFRLQWALGWPVSAPAEAPPSAPTEAPLSAPTEAPLSAPTEAPPLFTDEAI